MTFRLSRWSWINIRILFLCTTQAVPSQRSNVACELVINLEPAEGLTAIPNRSLPRETKSFTRWSAALSRGGAPRCLLLNIEPHAHDYRLSVMNRIDRLTSILLMLQSHRVLTAEKISDRFEISVRTVYRDLSALGEAGVPIIAEAGVGYSLMRGYNIPPIMFTESEVAALFMSAEITDQFGDDSLKKSLQGALLKVKSALPEGHQNYLNKLSSNMEVWSRPTAYQDKHSLMPVQEAVVKRRCMRIHYNTGSRGTITERTVEALGLLFYSRQWHLIAWCRLRQEIRDFRLDRMQQWEVTDETFTGHEDFSITEFIQQQTEVSELIPVQIECEPWVIDRVVQEIPCRIETKHSQENGKYLIHAHAYSLEWLARWLIGLGTTAIARSPDELRKRVSAEAAKITELYQ